MKIEIAQLEYNISCKKPYRAWVSEATQTSLGIFPYGNRTLYQFHSIGELDKFLSEQNDLLVFDQKGNEYINHKVQSF